MTYKKKRAAPDPYAIATSYKYTSCSPSIFSMGKMPNHPQNSLAPIPPFFKTSLLYNLWSHTFGNTGILIYFLDYLDLPVEGFDQHGLKQ
jgi:hypothetical protein